MQQQRPYLDHAAGFEVEKEVFPLFLPRAQKTKGVRPEAEDQPSEKKSKTVDQGLKIQINITTDENGCRTGMPFSSPGQNKYGTNGVHKGYGHLNKSQQAQYHKGLNSLTCSSASCGFEMPIATVSRSNSICRACNCLTSQIIQLRRKCPTSTSGQPAITADIVLGVIARGSTVWEGETAAR